MALISPSVTVTQILAVLPWQDWSALALFFFGWVGYAQFASWRA